MNVLDRALAVGLAVLVAVARPWRYVTARPGQRQDRNVASAG